MTCCTHLRYSTVLLLFITVFLKFGILVNNARYCKNAPLTPYISLNLQTGIYFHSYQSDPKLVLRLSQTNF